MKNGILGILVRGMLLGLLLSGIFLAGFFVRGIPAVASAVQGARPPQTESKPGSYPLLAEAQDLLNQHYLRNQPAQTLLEYGAIRGLLGTLNDKYTYFIDPPVAASESNVLAGQYGGIGVQVRRDEQGRFAIYPFRDGPAAKAGLQDGDLLLQVNGKEVLTSTQQDAVDQMLRGEVKVDNGVRIRVQRQPSGEKFDFSVAFAVIEVPSVVWRVLLEEPTFGYIQIIRFTNRTPGEIEQAIDDLTSKDKNVHALVLDLRDNPGGLLQESIQVAGQFLGKGTVLVERTRAGEKNLDAPDAPALTALPMVVLVNKGTASAAELVAGALKDRNRAFLLGQQTYGKGSVQVIFQLADKSALHITTAEWFPPSKTVLDGKGIAPDIAMIPDQNGRDVELGEAIRQLRDRKG